MAKKDKIKPESVTVILDFRIANDTGYKVDKEKAGQPVIVSVRNADEKTDILTQAYDNLRTKAAEAGFDSIIINSSEIITVPDPTTAGWPQTGCYITAVAAKLK